VKCWTGLEVKSIVAPCGFVFDKCRARLPSLCPPYKVGSSDAPQRKRGHVVVPATPPGVDSIDLSNMWASAFGSISLNVVLCSVSLGAITGLSVRAVSYRAIPHEATGYYSTPGRSSTSCYGNGDDWGYWITLQIKCKTVSTPPATIPVTFHSVEVYNLVEADGQLYTISCTAPRIGDRCAWLIPGQTFQAELKDRTMWVTARQWGNTEKENRMKFRLLDVRPDAPALASFENQNSQDGAISGTFSGIVRNETAGISAHFGIAIREEGGAVYGCIAIQKPLHGSGSLQGTVRGSQVSFDSIGSSLGSQFSIRFEGEVHGALLKGTYLVSSPSRQDGEFELLKRGSEAPTTGFNLKNCIKN